MSKRPLNEKQTRVYKYLLECLADSLPPSVREIAAACGIKSTSTVHAILSRLEEEGYISRDPRNSRAIRIEGMSKASQVPLIGKVTAGVPILAVEQIESYIPFTGGHISADSEMFALKVRGESMLGAGIYDGDILFVEKTPYARNGDIVVALIEDEATVKTFYKENGHFRLQPENDAFEPIIVDELVILGKAVAMMRYL